MGRLLFKGYLTQRALKWSISFIVISVVLSAVISAVISGVKIILIENGFTILLLNRQITLGLKSVGLIQQSSKNSQNGCFLQNN